MAGHGDHEVEGAPVRPEPEPRSAIRRDLVLIGAVLLASGGAVVVAGVLGGSEWAGIVLQWVLLLSIWTLVLWFTTARGRVDPRRAKGGLMAPSGGWLPAATASDDGIVIPARPASQGCDLALRADGVTVSAGWSAATLPWGRFRPWPGPLIERPGIPDPPNEGDSWSIAPHGATRGDAPIGIGIEVTGRVIEDTARVRAQRRTWQNRITRSFGGTVQVPLAAARTIDALLDGERSVVATLCQLLAERPELRRRLDDPRRVRRLVHDLVHRPLGPVPVTDPLPRRAFEITSSLKRLGYTHRLAGRPLPGEPTPSRAEVRGRIVDDLQRNPFSRDLDISSSQIEEIAGERFFVEPWPFAALLAD